MIGRLHAYISSSLLCLPASCFSITVVWNKQRLLENNQQNVSGWNLIINNLPLNHSASVSLDPIMKLSAVLLLIGSHFASATVIQRQNPATCCFSLIAQGGVSGPVGEDTIGENGIGENFPQSMYCVSNGSFTDCGGQPCAILSSNGQFVCESNSIPLSSSFMFADNGELLYDGSSNYFACPSPGLANNGSYNIFSGSIADSSGCTSITLLTGGFSCAAMGRPSSTSTITMTTNAAQSQPFTPVTAAATQCTTATSSCPTDISSGTYVAPNLIIPVSPESPNVAFGTQYSATITPENSTIFAFDIPYTYNGYCALIFLLPFGDDAQFPYTFSGIEEEKGSDGGLNFTLLNGVVNNATTFNSLPPVGTPYGTTEVMPGCNFTIAVGPCAGGETASYEVSSVGGVVLQYFQSTEGSPIGLWVVPCS